MLRTKALIMKLFLFFLLSLLLFPVCLTGQGGYKDHALEAYRAENLQQAIDLMEKARAENPEDPEVHYYLGYFAHYLMHDGIPVDKDRQKWSETMVLQNLEAALKQDPEMGDARYFLGVEHGALAREALKAGELTAFREAYRQGMKKGAYPAWMREEGRNLLRSCPPDAILVINGHLHWNALTYLQAMEGIRQDVTVVSQELLQQPWYIRALRDGIEGVIRAVPIHWKDHHLEEIRHYPWKSRRIALEVPHTLYEKYEVDPDGSGMHWAVEPDLVTPGKHTYISPAKAVFIHIMESNQWERPVMFSMDVRSTWNLDRYFQQYGALRRVLPFHAESHDLKMDIPSIRALYFNEENFSAFPGLAENNAPRFTSFLFNHHFVLLNLCRHYYEKEEWDAALEALDQIMVLFPYSVLPIPDDFLLFMRDMRDDIREKIRDQQNGG